MSFPAPLPGGALLFLPLALPLGLWVARADLRHGRIPNGAVLALLVVFAALGPLALGRDLWLARWCHLPVVLLIGAALHGAGRIGAGDAKLVAAMAPYVAASDLAELAFLAAGIAVPAALLARQRVMSCTGPPREDRHFPLGLVLGPLLPTYLALAGLAGG